MYHVADEVIRIPINPVTWKPEPNYEFRASRNRVKTELQRLEKDRLALLEGEKWRVSLAGESLAAWRFLRDLEERNPPPSFTDGYLQVYCRRMRKLLEGVDWVLKSYWNGATQESLASYLKDPTAPRRIKMMRTLVLLRRKESGQFPSQSEIARITGENLKPVLYELKKMLGEDMVRLSGTRSESIPIPSNYLPLLVYFDGLDYVGLKKQNNPSEPIPAQLLQFLEEMTRAIWVRLDSYQPMIEERLVWLNKFEEALRDSKAVSRDIKSLSLLYRQGRTRNIPKDDVRHEEALQRAVGLCWSSSESSMTPVRAYEKALLIVREKEALQTNVRSKSLKESSTNPLVS